jgi:D-lactate dehydrogenase (cytochrome)
MPVPGEACAGRVDAALVGALRDVLSERAVTTEAVRSHHSRGEGLVVSGMPDVVALPRTTDEVAAVARLCHAARVPVIPFGAGTSLEGHVAAVGGGVSIDLGGMNRILEVSPEALDCRVEAGVTRGQLNAELRTSGLHFPVDPGADASIGGMAATRASGTTAVRYGTMRENVLGLTVVTPDGRVVRTGGRARKSASGLDLTRLYVGSEGTLGIITEVQLRLQGLPEAVLAAVCPFPDLASAVGAATAVLQSGIAVVRMELLNAAQMAASIAFSRLDGLAATPTLFLEFNGSPASVREQCELTELLVSDFSGGPLRMAREAEERSRLWKARAEVYPADLALVPGGTMICTDACVPISELAACILETEEDIAETGLPAPILGHVGDGNFHVNIVYRADDEAQRSRAEGLARRVGLRAIRFGGTCTGEHGIGLHKREQLQAEHGEAVAVMAAIKAALDPRGIMNPGKMLLPSAFDHPFT